MCRQKVPFGHLNFVPSNAFWRVALTQYKIVDLKYYGMGLVQYFLYVMNVNSICITFVSMVFALKTVIYVAEGNTVEYPFYNNCVQQGCSIGLPRGPQFKDP